MELEVMNEEQLITYYLKDECGMIWHGEWSCEEDARWFAKSANMTFIGTSCSDEEV